MANSTPSLTIGTQSRKIGKQPRLSLEAAWKHIDKIYCITLASRPDRRRSASEQFEKAGLAELVEFVVVEKHPSDSEQGIFESHLACLREGLAAGAKKIAIFEDDVLLSRVTPERVMRCVRFMDSTDDWQLFFFGCFVDSSKKTRHKGIIKVAYKCLAHAYVVSEGFARQIVDMPWQDVPYDVLLRNASRGATFAIYPSLAFQSNAATDNDKRLGLDRTRRLFGGFRRLQRWNEFSSLKLVPMIIGHVLTVLVVVLLILRHYHKL